MEIFFYKCEFLSYRRVTSTLLSEFLLVKAVSQKLPAQQFIYAQRAYLGVPFSATHFSSKS